MLTEKFASMVSGAAPTTKSLPTIDVTKYANLFLDAFESRLTIDDAKLDAAGAAAVSETVAQAVKDGVITTAQADQANAFAKMGARELAPLANKGFAGMLGFAKRSGLGEMPLTKPSPTQK